MRSRPSSCAGRSPVDRRLDDISGEAAYQTLSARGRAGQSTLTVRRGRIAFALLAATVVGHAGSSCIVGGTFVCNEDDECGANGTGVCEASGWCSFPDPDCPSGRRYSPWSGDDPANDCAPADPGSDASTTYDRLARRRGVELPTRAARQRGSGMRQRHPRNRRGLRRDERRGRRRLQRRLRVLGHARVGDAHREPGRRFRPRRRRRIDGRRVRRGPTGRPERQCVGVAARARRHDPVVGVLRRQSAGRGPRHRARRKSARRSTT